MTQDFIRCVEPARGGKGPPRRIYAEGRVFPGVQN